MPFHQAHPPPLQPESHHPLRAQLPQQPLEVEVEQGRDRGVPAWSSRRKKSPFDLALAEAVDPIDQERRPTLERLVLQRPKVGHALDEEVGERGASLCGGGREGDARELERVALVLQLAGSPDAVVADVGRPRSHAGLAVRHAPSRRFKPLPWQRFRASTLGARGLMQFLFLL